MASNAADTKKFWIRRLTNAARAIEKDPGNKDMLAYARVVASLFTACRPLVLADEDILKIEALEKRLDQENEALIRGQAIEAGQDTGYREADSPAGTIN